MELVAQFPILSKQHKIISGFVSEEQKVQCEPGVEISPLLSAQAGQVALKINWLPSKRGLNIIVVKLH